VGRPIMRAGSDGAALLVRLGASSFNAWRRHAQYLSVLRMPESVTGSSEDREEGDYARACITPRGSLKRLGGYFLVPDPTVVGWGSVKCISEA